MENYDIGLKWKTFIGYGKIPGTYTGYKIFFSGGGINDLHFIVSLLKAVMKSTEIVFKGLTNAWDQYNFYILHTITNNLFILISLTYEVSLFNSYFNCTLTIFSLDLLSEFPGRMLDIWVNK